jgi:uncharacterized protein YjiK
MPDRARTGYSKAMLFRYFSVACATCWLLACSGETSTDSPSASGAHSVAPSSGADQGGASGQAGASGSTGGVGAGGTGVGGSGGGASGTAGIAGDDALGGSAGDGSGGVTAGSASMTTAGSGGVTAAGSSGVTAGSGGMTAAGSGGVTAGGSGPEATAGGGSAGLAGDEGSAADAGDGGQAGAEATPLSEYVPEGSPIELSDVTGASDITWKPSTDTFFVVMDRFAELREYDFSFTEPVRVIEIQNGPADAEGLTYLGVSGGLDRFALAAEANDDVVYTFELAPDAAALDMGQALLQTYVPSEAPSVANSGFEGVAFRPGNAASGPLLYACQEGSPDQVPIRVLSFPYAADGLATLSYADSSLLVSETWDAQEKLGTVAGDLSGLHYDTESDTLLVLSHLGSRLLRVAPSSGDILDELVLDRSPQYEGVTLASEGRLVFVSEPNFVEIFRREP